jgi:hypothetical protein
MTDNQIRLHTPYNGWGSFAYKEGAAEWSPEQWEAWPHINVCIDMGSDGLCAHHGLSYYYQVNTTRWCDLSHATHKDFDLLLKGLGLHKMWIVVDLHEPSSWPALRRCTVA